MKQLASTKVKSLFVLAFLFMAACSSPSGPTSSSPSGGSSGSDKSSEDSNVVLAAGATGTEGEAPLSAQAADPAQTPTPAEVAQDAEVPVTPPAAVQPAAATAPQAPRPPSELTLKGRTIHASLLSLWRSVAFAGTVGTETLTNDAARNRLNEIRAEITSYGQGIESRYREENGIPDALGQLTNYFSLAIRSAEVSARLGQAFSRSFGQSYCLTLSGATAVGPEVSSSAEVDVRIEGQTIRLCPSESYLAGASLGFRRFANRDARLLELSQAAISQNLFGALADVWRLMSTEDRERKENEAKQILVGSAVPELRPLVESQMQSANRRNQRTDAIDLGGQIVSLNLPAPSILDDALLLALGQALFPQANATRADQFGTLRTHIMGDLNSSQVRTGGLALIIASHQQEIMRSIEGRGTTLPIGRWVREGEALALLTSLARIDDAQEEPLKTTLRNLVLERIRDQNAPLPEAIRAWEPTALASIRVENIREHARTQAVERARADLATIARLQNETPTGLANFEIFAEVRREQAGFQGGSNTLGLWRSAILGERSFAGALDKWLEIAREQIRVDQIVRQAPESDQVALRLGFSLTREHLRILAGSKRAEARRLTNSFVRDQAARVIPALRNEAANILLANQKQREAADIEGLILAGDRLGLRFVSEESPIPTIEALRLSASDLADYKKNNIDRILARNPVALASREFRLPLDNLDALLANLQTRLVDRIERVLIARQLSEIETIIGTSDAFKALISQYPGAGLEREEWLRSRLTPTITGAMWEHFFQSYVTVGGMGLIGLHGLKWLAPRILPRWAAYLEQANTAVTPFLRGYNNSLMATIAAHIGMDTYALLEQRQARDMVRELSALAVERDTAIFTLAERNLSDMMYDARRAQYLMSRSMDMGFLVLLPAGLYGSAMWNRLRGPVHETRLAGYFRDLGMPNQRWQFDRDLIEDFAALRQREQAEVTEFWRLFQRPNYRAPRAGEQMPMLSRFEANPNRLEDLLAQNPTSGPAVHPLQLEAHMRETLRIEEARRGLVRELARTERRLARLASAYRFDFEAIGVRPGNWNVLEWREMRVRAEAELAPRDLQRFKQSYENLMAVAMRSMPQGQLSRLLQMEVMSGGGRHREIMEAAIREGQAMPNDYPIEVQVIRFDLEGMPGGQAELIVTRRAGTGASAEATP